MFTFAFVGISIGEALCLACFASKQTPEVGTNFVLATLLHSMALGTLLDKCLLAFVNVSRHAFSEKRKKFNQLYRIDKPRLTYIVKLKR